MLTTTTFNLNYGLHTVSTVISSCAKSIYALRTLRSHGMDNEALHMIYTSVIIAKLLFAASAWWGFTTAIDGQRLEALIKRGIRSGLCGADVSSLAELVDSADDALFNTNYTIPTTFYTHCYPISMQQDTILDIVVMTEFYLRRLDVCRLMTF